MILISAYLMYLSHVHASIKHTKEGEGGGRRGKGGGREGGLNYPKPSPLSQTSFREEIFLKKNYL